MLPQLPQDKANHALYGAAIFLAVGLVASHLGAGNDSRMFGALAAALAGAAKEYSDFLLNKRAIAKGQLPPHGVEFMDFAATTGGALFCWLAAIATGG